MVHITHIGMLSYYLLACYIGMSWLQLAHICGWKVNTCPYGHGSSK